MDNLRTDSPISRRITRSFLDFLDSVEAAPGVDLEGLEIAKECLAEVFKLDSPSLSDQSKSDSLIEIFSSLELAHRNTPDLNHAEDSVGASSSSPAPKVADCDVSRAPNAVGEDLSKGPPHLMVVSKDELFGKFFAALEKAKFFISMPDGNDDPIQLDKATRIFHEALKEIAKSDSPAFNVKSLAEVLKCQGNKAMQSKLYSDAIEFYSFAIALYESSAVYYCNRAAAYTNIHKYTEAIKDCLKSVEIDPNYSKAFSRLGLVYYAQGNYTDAIEKGFKKALQLDPNNETVKENIRMAQQKLNEEQQQSARGQSTNSNHSYQESNTGSAGWSTSYSTTPQFSMNINNTTLPVDIASLFANMSGNVQPSQSQQGEDTNASNQESNNHSTTWSTNHGTPPQFNMNLNPADIPANLATMFMNMGGNVHDGPSPQNRQGGEGNNMNESGGPNGGGNVNLGLGEGQMPEEVRGALRSVMQMFSGGSTQGNSQDTTTNRGPTGN